MITASKWIMVIHSCIVLLLSIFWVDISAKENLGWEPFSPREEISPKFKYFEKDQGGNEYLLINQGNQFGEIGAWSKSYAIKGGNYYRISVLCHGSGLPNPRDNRYVEVFFSG